MSAAEALNAARAAGIRVEIDGDRLALIADEEPPPAVEGRVIDLLSRNKAGLIALLRPWTAQDWQAHFEKQAALAECKGGLPREQAEARAFACCVSHWLNRNPICSSPDYCLGCGGPDQPGDPLLPFGTETNAWLHSTCWSDWEASRKREAVAALSSLGTHSPE